MKKRYVSKEGYGDLVAEIVGDTATIFDTNCFGENPFQVEAEIFHTRYEVDEEQV